MLVVPFVALVFGSHWTLRERLEPPTARLVSENGRAESTVTTYLVPEAAQLEPGIVLAPGDLLTFPISDLSGPFDVDVQAFSRDVLELSASADGTGFEPLWRVPALGHRGLRTRSASFEAPDQPIRFLRLRPLARHPDHRVSGIRVAHTIARIPHWALLPALWGAFALLLAAREWSRTRSIADGVLAGWRRADVWLATALVVAILFHLNPEVLVVAGAVGLAALGIALVAHYLRRSPLITVVYLLFLYVLFGVFLPWAVTRVAAARAGQLYDLTVDHRMRPDGQEINADGIRFKGTAADLREQDFVVLHLGDSFTYGFDLAYEDTYPYAYERILRRARCASPVRAVNLGWTSSSPLLSLRLLRQIGSDYRPDLVVYNLDMTDFGDDLRYEQQLREAGDLEIDHRAVARQLVEALTPRLPVMAGIPETLSRLLRRNPAEREPEDLAVPDDRFFATARSLEDTRAAIERGVMKNLAELDRFSREELDADFAVVIYPRAYQYSRRESPRNWEDRRYQRLGSHVLEPFRYFAEVRDELPYPVIDLLPAFQRTDRFPLFLDDDPHWSREGAAFVAELVAEWSIESGAVPCVAQ